MRNEMKLKRRFIENPTACVNVTKLIQHTNSDPDDVTINLLFIFSKSKIGRLIRSNDTRWYVYQTIAFYFIHSSIGTCISRNRYLFAWRMSYRQTSKLEALLAQQVVLMSPKINFVLPSIPLPSANKFTKL